MRKLLFFIAFSVIAQTPTQVDYNSQIRNKPTSYTATGTLAASVAMVPAGGILFIPAGVWPVSANINITKNLAIQCDSGATIKPTLSNLLMFNVTAQLSVSGCLFDGQFSQSGYTGVAGIVSSGGPYVLTVTNCIFQNIDFDGIAVGHLGTFESRYNQFLAMGTGTVLNDVRGGITQYGANNPALFISDHDIFNGNTSGNGIHLFNPNTGGADLALKEVIRIDYPTVTGVDRIAIEGATADALSLTITNPIINKSASEQFGISWQMASSAPNSDLDGSITIIGGVFTAFPGNPFGHGVAMELFSRHSIVDGVNVTSQASSYGWDTAITSGGALQVSNSTFTNTDQAITGNSVVPQTNWKITNNIFNESCNFDVGSGGLSSMLLSGNTFNRTPGSCPRDSIIGPCSGSCYAAVIAGTANPGGAIYSNNHFIWGNAVLPASFNIAGFDTGPDTAEFDQFTGNEFVNLYSAPQGTAFASFGSQRGMFNQTITSNLFSHILQVADTNSGQPVRYANNIDVTNSLPNNSNGISWVANDYYPWSSVQSVCSAFTNGIQINISDSNTQAFGTIVSSGGGALPVKAQCNATMFVNSGTYTSGGSVTGTATQTCTLTIPGPTTATVALTGLNTIAGGTVLTGIAFAGSATYLTAPTTATLTSGTATCSGTAVIATVLTAPQFTVVGR